MPLTQDRMLAVLSEAEAAHNAYGILRGNIEHVMKAQLPAEAVLSAIKQMLETLHMPGREAITREGQHFARAKARNERNTKNQRALRARKRAV